MLNIVEFNNKLSACMKGKDQTNIESVKYFSNTKKLETKSTATVTVDVVTKAGDKNVSVTFIIQERKSGVATTVLNNVTKDVITSTFGATSHLDAIDFICNYIVKSVSKFSDKKR